MAVLVDPARVITHVEGYPATVEPDGGALVYQALLPGYAEDQERENVARTDRYLMPILQRIGARCLLDAGCGVGATVQRLNEHGLDAHGFDLLEQAPVWAAANRPRDRFVITGPLELALPFPDASFDCVFSFGVLEHVGTMDGHATRRPDYHAIRTRWTRELFRVVRPGGYLLLGGPNRRFPVDTAHGLDAASGRFERWLSRKLRVSVHRVWGDYFLWSHGDVKRYLAGLPCSIEALSVDGLANYTRVPWPLGGMARAYVRHLPRPLLGTGFNPWVMALVRREA